MSLALSNLVDYPLKSLGKTLTLESRASQDGPFTVGDVPETQLFHDLVAIKSRVEVLLVGKNQQRHSLELWVLEYIDKL